jgi:hypothetical protein
MDINIAKIIYIVFSFLFLELFLLLPLFSYLNAEQL